MIRHPRQGFVPALLITLVLVLSGCDVNTTHEGAGSGTPTGPSPSTSTPTATTTIIGEIPDGPLQPGRYALAPIGPLDEPFAVVDIPTGYHSWTTFIEADEPAGLEDPLMLGLWLITKVYENPCAESHPVKPTSVRATANAFLRQRFTLSIAPREVELAAGYHGLYMEVTTPTDFDYFACDDAEVNLWDGRPDGTYWTRMPGMVNRLWILDVDGQPMMIHLAVPPSATNRQIHAMTRIVEGAEFEASVG